MRALDVLLIEDNVHDIRQQTEMLKRAGCTVRAARSGEEGLALARAKRPDALISDLMLVGGMSGYAVARAFRDDAELKDVPRAAITATDTESARGHAKLAGFQKFIVKPIGDDPDELAEEIAELFAPEEQQAIRYCLLKARMGQLARTQDQQGRILSALGENVRDVSTRVTTVERAVLLMRDNLLGLRNGLLGYYRIARTEATAAAAERRFNGETYQKLQATLDQDQAQREVLVGLEESRGGLEAARVETEQKRLKAENRIFWAVVALILTIIVMWGRWS